ncbi:hypothetical protein VOLCADRAFT_98552, partial [Volvox carteri f. nagariensis]
MKKCLLQIPDLDRGFSNLLKKTYKELYDSLKELTSKGSTKPGPPGTSSAAPPAASGRGPETPPGLNQSQQPRTGTTPPPPDVRSHVALAEAALVGSSAQTAAGLAAGNSASSQPTSARDLSALARLVHAKRLHQQADGAAASRENDHPAPRRPARVPTPASSASGAARLAALYDGLPPARVATGSCQGTQAAMDEAGQVPAVQQPAAPGTAAPTGPGSQQAVAVLDNADTITADVPAIRDHASLEGDIIPSRGGGPAHEGGTGCSSVGGQGGLSQCREQPPGNSGGGSRRSSQQLLEQARASGSGLARSLLLHTAQPTSATASEGPDPPGRMMGLAGKVPASERERRHTVLIQAQLVAAGLGPGHRLWWGSVPNGHGSPAVLPLNLQPAKGSTLEMCGGPLRPSVMASRVAAEVATDAALIGRYFGSKSAASVLSRATASAGAVASQTRGTASNAE